MAGIKTKNNGHIAYGVCEFVVDTVADIDNLPIEVAMGSTVFVIATSSVYMLNSDGEWKEI